MLRQEIDYAPVEAIALEPQHGWAIFEHIHQISGDVLKVQQGSLYPALQRRGWIKASWDVSDNNRRAKYYELTRAGRTALGEQAAAWRSLTTAVGLLLDTT